MAQRRIENTRVHFWTFRLYDNIINQHLDEHIWATLQRYPPLPGYEPPNTKYDSNDFKSLARYVEWFGQQD